MSAYKPTAPQRQETQQLVLPRRNARNGTRRAALALATLATGVSYAALMSNRGAHATPIGCPVPNGTVIDGNTTIDVGGVCVIGATDILSTGRLDIDRAFPAAAGRTLNNAGALNVNANLLVNGSLDNAASGTLTNRAELLVDSVSAPANLTNRGALNNEAGGTIRNTGILSNESGGTFDNAGALITGGDTTANRNALINRGILNNSGALTQSESPGGSSLDNYGVLNNTGQIDFAAGGGNYDRFRNREGGRIYNSGAITQRGASELTNDGALINRSGGLLDAVGIRTGQGSASASLTNETGGTIRSRGLSRFGAVVTNQAGALIETDSLAVQENATLDNAGTFSSSTSPGILSSSGAIVNQSGGIFDARFSTVLLQNGASITNRAGGLFDASGAGGFGSFLTEAGTFIGNAGEFRVAGGVSIQTGRTDQNDSADFVQTGGSTVVDGTIALNTVDIRGGTLTGSGTVGASSRPVTVGQNATLAPGNSPGTMVINSDFECDACLVEIEIGGRNDGEFDFIDISGSATFSPGSRVAFSFIDGFAPLQTDLFEFIEADGGFFGVDEINFSVAGLEDGFVFDVANIFGKNSAPALALNAGNDGQAATSVPEPAMGGLIGLGLLAMGYLRRRFRQPQALAA